MADSRVVRLAVPATLLDVRSIDEAVVAMLQRASGVDEGVIRSVELAVHEICVNIVEHAYGDGSLGRINVSMKLTGGAPRSILVELQDRGRPFDPATVAAVDLDTPHEGGYGMFLAHSLLDEVIYERRSGRNIWRLSKLL